MSTSILKMKGVGGQRKLALQEVIEGLMNDGILGRGDGEKILKNGKLSKKHPLLIIGKSGVTNQKTQAPLEMEDLAVWLATFSGVPYLEIDPLKIDIDAVTKILPPAYIKRIGVLPVEVKDKSVVFATCEPFDKSWLLDTSANIKKDIEVVVANPEKIELYIHEFYEVRSAITSMDDDRPVSNAPLENANLADEGHVAKLVDWLFQFAATERASDIHLEPRDGQAQMRFRIDGTLRVVYKFQPQVFLPILSRLKIMADMKVDEKRRPQDGRIKRKLESGKVMELRISTIPTHYGEKMVIRIFDPGMGSKSFKDVGFSPKDIERWQHLIEQNYGIILVTGPTGSGKTTTLQTTLSYLAKPDVNICTVEDPIEIINENFSQMQVHHEIGLTFGNAIRSFLRQDPDIIMVGEIRDRDAADMAIQASLTGHLVLSTLHTNNALSSITRLLDIGVEPHLLSASLLGVLAQRLVKVLCPHCKEQVDTHADMWRALVAPFNVQMPKTIYKARGCRSCKNTGYHGRMIVYELVTIDNPIKDIIRSNVTLMALEEAAKGKYLPMRLNGAQRVIQGLTTIEEVLRVIV